MYQIIYKIIDKIEELIKQHLSVKMIVPYWICLTSAPGCEARTLTVAVLRHCCGWRELARHPGSRRSGEGRGHAASAAALPAAMHSREPGSEPATSAWFQPIDSQIIIKPKPKQTD